MSPDSIGLYRASRGGHSQIMHSSPRSLSLRSNHSDMPSKRAASRLRISPSTASFSGSLGNQFSRLANWG